MTNFSKTALSLEEDGTQYTDIYNHTWTSSSSSDDLYVIWFYFIMFVCIIGLVGNGTVICLLGFHIKRNPFTTYILNLAVADFGVLLCFGLFITLSLIQVERFFLQGVSVIATIFMHNVSQILMTAISIDRCVSILFPIWHRCHRPPHLSTIECAIIWVFSGMPSGSLLMSLILENVKQEIFIYEFIAIAILCLPRVTISTMILLFKVFCKSQQPQRKRLLTIILLTLLFFLLFALPLDAILTFIYFTHSKHNNILLCGYLCTNLNSCVNPVIYFLVGRKKRGHQRQSLKVILQRAFKEDEQHRAEQDTMIQTSL